MMASNKKGNKLETIVNNSLKKINSNGLGFFIKSPIPNKAIPINGTYKFIYSAKALCDFIGIYNQKFILIECKEISGNRFPKERLKDHQVNQLTKINEFGGISIIIFYIKESDKYLAMKITRYLELVNLEMKKSISVSNILENSFHLYLNDKEIIDLKELFI